MLEEAGLGLFVSCSFLSSQTSVTALGKHPRLEALQGRGSVLLNVVSLLAITVSSNSVNTDYRKEYNP